jgi:hypothetical protein
MPWLTDLDDRLDADPDWRTSYDEKLPKARMIAHAVPLLHVTNHPDPTRVRFEDLLLESPHALPTSSREGGYCSDKTRWAEKKLDIPHCVYFYAARAFVGFGRITLAFDERRLSADAGGHVSPLDSGGWGLKCIKSNLPNQMIATLREFMAKATVDLEEWREDFARFLAAYFSPLTAYWAEEPPWRLDPEEIYEPSRKNHWRGWVFEVRLAEPVSLLDAVRWCVSEDEFKKLVSRAEDEGKLPIYGETALTDFLFDSSDVFTEDEETHSCSKMEGWVLDMVRSLA